MFMMKQQLPQQQQDHDEILTISREQYQMGNNDGYGGRKRTGGEWIRHYRGQINGQVSVSGNSGNGGNDRNGCSDRNGMSNGDLVPELALNRVRPTWNVLIPAIQDVRQSVLTLRKIVPQIMTQHFVLTLYNHIHTQLQPNTHNNIQNNTQNNNKEVTTCSDSDQVQEISPQIVYNQNKTTPAIIKQQERQGEQMSVQEIVIDEQDEQDGQVEGVEGVLDQEKIKQGKQNYGYYQVYEEAQEPQQEQQTEQCAEIEQERVEKHNHYHNEIVEQVKLQYVQQDQPQNHQQHSPQHDNAPQQPQQSQEPQHRQASRQQPPQEQIAKQQPIAPQQHPINLAPNSLPPLKTQPLASQTPSSQPPPPIKQQQSLWQQQLLKIGQSLVISFQQYGNNMTALHQQLIIQNLSPSTHKLNIKHILQCILKSSFLQLQQFIRQQCQPKEQVTPNTIMQQYGENNIIQNMINAVQKYPISQLEIMCKIMKGQVGLGYQAVTESQAWMLYRYMQSQLRKEIGRKDSSTKQEQYNNRNSNSNSIKQENSTYNPLTPLPQITATKAIEMAVNAQKLKDMKRRGGQFREPQPKQIDQIRLLNRVWNSRIQKQLIHHYKEGKSLTAICDILKMVHQKDKDHIWSGALRSNLYKILRQAIRKLYSIIQKFGSQKLPFLKSLDHLQVRAIIYTNLGRKVRYLLLDVYTLTNYDPIIIIDAINGINQYIQACIRDGRINYNNKSVGLDGGDQVAIEAIDKDSKVRRGRYNKKIGMMEYQKEDVILLRQEEEGRIQRGMKRFKDPKDQRKFGPFCPWY